MGDSSSHVTESSDSDPDRSHSATGHTMPPTEVRAAENRLLERLTGMEAEEIVPCISDGDPLGVQNLVMRRLREQGLIIDPTRAFEHALREIAFDTALAGPEHLHSDWLQTSIDRSLTALVARDEEDDRQSSGGPPLDNEPFEFVFLAFGARREYARHATVDFHKLPLRTRLAFFALLVDEFTVEQCLETGLWDAPSLRRDCWDAFCALGLVSQDEVEETFRNGGPGPVEQREAQ